MRERDFDVIFMNIQMPETDGIAATNEFISWEKEVSRLKTLIIAISVTATEKEKILSSIAGFVIFLTGPLEKQSLLRP